MTLDDRRDQMHARAVVAERSVVLFDFGFLLIVIEFCMIIKIKLV